MSFRRFAPILFSVPLLLGCGEVITDAPLGETPVSVQEEDWEGIWVAPEEVYMVEVLDEAEGRLLVGEITGGQSPEVEDLTEMQLSRIGDWYFANWETEPGEFQWFRVHRKGDHIIIWLAEFDGFAALVDQGVMPGEIRSSGSDDEVFIGPLTDEHLEIITEGSDGALFDWENPGTLYRVQGPERGGRRNASVERNQLTARDLAAYDTLNAHETVHRLRRFWLEGPPGSSRRVFVNDQDAGDLSVLAEYPVEQILELRYIRQRNTEEWFGSTVEGGVILVRTKRGGE